MCCAAACMHEALVERLAAAATSLWPVEEKHQCRQSIQEQHVKYQDVGLVWHGPATCPVPRVIFLFAMQGPV